MADRILASVSIVSCFKQMGSALPQRQQVASQRQDQACTDRTSAPAGRAEVLSNQICIYKTLIKRTSQPHSMMKHIAWSNAAAGGANSSQVNKC
jgi:hypothetical protein